jgi:hypothetical protein
LGNYGVVISNAFGSVTSAVANIILQPQFTAVTLSNGNVTFSFSGAPGSNYVVLFTTNLTPQVIWKPLSTNTADSLGNVTVLDANTNLIPAKFYRVTVE